jgi:hypothetical protein
MLLLREPSRRVLTKGKTSRKILPSTLLVVGSIPTRLQ